MFLRTVLLFLSFFSLHTLATASPDGPLTDVENHYADSNGVTIHFVRKGQGHPVLMIHGFPDYWYSWRHQIEGLSDEFQTIAMDQRGYNLSGQPTGVDNYSMEFLVQDVLSVLDALEIEQATIVGHDWGGAVAWQVAMLAPNRVANLIVLNLPHPDGLARELKTNLVQQQNSGYAEKFINGQSTDPDIFFGGPMNATTLAGWVREPTARLKYIEAFKRSNLAGMLNFYKANYPDRGQEVQNATVTSPRVKSPVLIFHGLEDQALHSDGLNNTWDWIDADLSILTIPNAGHFVQHDASEMVTDTMRSWIKARTK